MTSGRTSEIQHAYFIGIGGIGMSALARFYHRQGIEVSGYDRDHSQLVDQLMSEGIDVHFDDDISLIEKTPDLVVYTPAIPEDHTELSHFKSSEVPVLKRAEVLGLLSRKMRCVSVAGTHGKTTTSTMLAFLLKASGLNVTAFLGGIAADFKGNFVAGDSDWMITEADEYDRSFLHLSSEIAVVTSMDPDHLDIYGSAEAMFASYRAFIRGLRDKGTLIAHESIVDSLINADLQDFIETAGITVLRYGTDAANDYVILNMLSNQHMQFELQMRQEKRENVRMSMSGAHNVLNATAAIAAASQIAQQFDAKEWNGDIDLSALQRFKGIKRRFERVFDSEDLTIIDDYAHHPQELTAAIAAAKLAFPGKKITGVFQPHLYTRTRDFHGEFARSLSSLDVCIVTEIYAAREQPIEGVNTELIYDQLSNKERYNVSKERLLEILETIKPEVLLLLGAGDLDRMIPEIIDRLKH